MGPYTQAFMHTMANWNEIELCECFFLFHEKKPLLRYAKDCGRHAQISNRHEERRERESAKKWKQNSHRQIEVATQNKILNTLYYSLPENNDDDDDDKNETKKKKNWKKKWNNVCMKPFQRENIPKCRIVLSVFVSRFAMFEQCGKWIIMNSWLKTMAVP